MAVQGAIPAGYPRAAAALASAEAAADMRRRWGPQPVQDECVRAGIARPDNPPGIAEVERAVIRRSRRGNDPSRRSVGTRPIGDGLFPIWPSPRGRPPRAATSCTRGNDWNRVGGSSNHGRPHGIGRAGEWRFARPSIPDWAFRPGCRPAVASLGPGRHGMAGLSPPPEVGEKQAAPEWIERSCGPHADIGGERAVGSFPRRRPVPTIEHVDKAIPNERTRRRENISMNEIPSRSRLERGGVMHGILPIGATFPTAAACFAHAAGRTSARGSPAASPEPVSSFSVGLRFPAAR